MAADGDVRSAELGHCGGRFPAAERGRRSAKWDPRAPAHTVRETAWSKKARRRRICAAELLTGEDEETGAEGKSKRKSRGKRVEWMRKLSKSTMAGL